MVTNWRVESTRRASNVIQAGRGDRRKEKSIVSFKPVRQFCIWNGWLIAHFHNFHLHLYPLIIPGPKFQPRNEIILFCWHVNARLATAGWHKIHVELPTETFTVNIQRKREKERKKRGEEKGERKRREMHVTIWRVVKILTANNSFSSRKLSLFHRFLSFPLSPPMLSYCRFLNVTRSFLFLFPSLC